MRLISFRGKRSRRVRLSIDPRTEFRRILQVVEEMGFPECGISPENVRFAVLELINNSLRAHRERAVDRPISVVFEAAGGHLQVHIRDHGGGFDPAILPYRLEEDLRQVDPLSPSFQRYQEEHNYQRFGMGLFLTRRTFPRFELTFLDRDDRPVSWQPGRVEGTLIRMGTDRED